MGKHKTNYTPNSGPLSTGLNGLGLDMNTLVEGTGWRDIRNLIVTGGTTPPLLDGLDIMREGMMVHARFLNIRGNKADGTGVNFVTALPVGFRPSVNLYFRPIVEPGWQITVGSAGALGCNGLMDTSDSSWIELSWIAAGAFPAEANWPGVAK